MSDYTPVVTVTPTIMDGTVVRWYRSLAAAESGFPVATASRNLVTVNAELRTLDDLQALVDLLHAAYDVKATLAAGRVDDVKPLATHRPRSFLGPLVPIEQVAR